MGTQAAVTTASILPRAQHAALSHVRVSGNLIFTGGSAVKGGPEGSVLEGEQGQRWAPGTRSSGWFVSVLIRMGNLGISYVALLPVPLEWGGPAWVSLLSPLSLVSSLLPPAPPDYDAQALSLSLRFPIEITGCHLFPWSTFYVFVRGVSRHCPLFSAGSSLASVSSPL